MRGRGVAAAVTWAVAAVFCMTREAAIFRRRKTHFRMTIGSACSTGIVRSQGLPSDGTTHSITGVSYGVCATAVDATRARAAMSLFMVLRGRVASTPTSWTVGSSVGDVRCGEHLLSMTYHRLAMTSRRSDKMSCGDGAWPRRCNSGQNHDSRTTARPRDASPRMHCRSVASRGHTLGRGATPRRRQWGAWVQKRRVCIKLATEHERQSCAR